jgi:hypothetical protein
VQGFANNKDLAVARERIAEAKGLTRQAGVRPAPTLGLNGVTGKQLGTIGEEQFGAEYSQPVETFGKRGKRIRVAEFLSALRKPISSNVPRNSPMRLRQPMQRYPLNGIS